MFKGSVVALVTPMQVNGLVDEPCLVDLVEWHINEGTEGFVVVGTTGESATLSEAERLRLIQLVVKQVHKRVPVFAGTGTNSTASTIAFTKEAKAAGADGALVVTPYYNRPTQDGLFQHFSALAEAIDLPLMLYNVPARTACDLLPKTVGLLAESFPHIVGIKEATGDLHRLAELKERCPQDFLIMSGDDATAMEFMLQGAHGVISVLANILPKAMCALCTAALSGDTARAHVLNESLATWYGKLGLEPNPIPVKWLLQKMGKIPPGIRLPLTPLSAVFHARLLTLLEQKGVNYV